MRIVIAASMGDDKESQKPVLPKDIFRNKLTFTIHEVSTFRRPRVVSGLGLGLYLGLGWAAAKTNFIATCNGLLLFVSATFALLLFVFMLIFPFCYLDNMRLRLDITPLVQQVSELKPGTDIQRWDELAHRLNLTLYQERFWNTPYYFFNGEHAQYVFSQRVVRQYFKGTFDDITDADKIQTVRDYLQSLNEKFEISLKEDLPQFPLSPELPRDTQWSFFFFFQRLHTCQIVYLCCQQIVAFNIIFGSLLGFLVSFAFYLLGQFLTCVDCCRFMRSIYPKLEMIQVINFLAIITKVNPREELDNWDRIAMFMNRYVTEENGGYSKNIFFDGKQCLNFYKTYFEQLSVDNYKNNFIDLKEIAESVKSKID